MCGIAGVARRFANGIDSETLLRMAAALRHRGPDGHGIYVGRNVGLAHTRLRIIDIAGGAQPLTNEDGRIVVTFNGEIFNYVELRRELIGHGHVFRTASDTEVLVHGYEEWGVELLQRLNGQFAFVIYDAGEQRVFLARDRFGIRPLYFALQHGDLWFASEAKALFATGEVIAAPDLVGLDEVFTFWSARAPRTVFRGVSQLEPGSFGIWSDGALHLERYHSLDFSEGAAEDAGAIDTLDAVLRDAVALQLRADVPVGGYLSGGLDSSLTCALAAPLTPYQLRTFSVTFADAAFDETAFQRVVTNRLRSAHASQRIAQREIAEVFPDVVRHAETPLVRTAPAPMYLLSRLTRDSGVKVVLSGEGADEAFLGYDLFKETVVRRFCLRQPQSKLRPRLFDRLYPYLRAPGHGGGEIWRQFFLTAGAIDDPLFSHLPRFNLTSRIKDAYSAEARAALEGIDVSQELRDSLPLEFQKWSPLGKAAWLETNTLLSGYLLSSQGERMGMAHAVEGRFPFLDHRLFEFASALPSGSKLRGLHEKSILRRFAARVLPPEVTARAKQPYRAPDVAAFFGAGEPEFVSELLSATQVRRTGIFDHRAVAGLVRRCRSGRATGFRENQALVAIISTHLWHDHFFCAKAQPTGLALHRADTVLSEEQPALTTSWRK